MKKRVFSMLLVIAIVLSGISAWFVTTNTDRNAENSEVNREHVEVVTDKVEGPIELVVNETADVQPQDATFVGTVANGENSMDSEKSHIVNQSEQRISEIIAEDMPQDDDVVDFIVVMNKEPLLSVFAAEDVQTGTGAVANYRDEQLQMIGELEDSLKEAFGGEEGFQLGFNYTVSTTGVSVQTRYGNKEAIEQMAGVEKVYVSPTFEALEDDAKVYTSNASTMIGASVMNSTGYTGKGMKIAILDTGIVVDHPSFQALPEDKLTEDSMTQEFVKGIWDTLNAGKTTLRNSSYHNSKLPFIFNYDGMNFDVSHTTAQHDHGTHVAGIAAANAIDSTSVVGIAPDAQLIVMQVFNRNGGAEWATILAALEDCVRLDVDTVNLSLGSAAGFTDGDMEMTMTLAQFQKTDIQVVIAGGNDTNNAYMNRTGFNMSKTKDPDNGLIGTPATASAALSVASAENDGAELLYFTVGDRKIGFSDSAVSESTNFFQNYRNESLEFVVIGGNGDSGDYTGVDVTGKVAVVSRGVISFQEKQAAAQSAGAKALIVYNNVPGSFSMAISDGAGHIPCISISKSDGEYLKSMASGTLQVCDGDLIHVNIDRSMSEFSSWGVTPDLKLKPEITGVGGNIYSTRDMSIGGSNYGNMSGTSMASPQVAGAITVLTQYLRENHEDAYQSEQELRQLAVNLLMSTATQIMEDETEYSPRNQGAGLVNLTDATAAGAYLSNPEVEENRPRGEMGDNDAKDGVFTFPFKITNMTSEAKNYSFDSSVLTPDVSGTYMTNTTRALQTEVRVSENGANKTEITVPANGSVSLTATITLTSADKEFINTNFENGVYVEGYLYVNSSEDDGVDLSMPFLGFFGDWSAAPVFDEEGEDASLFAPVLYTNKSKLGQNPYFPGGRAGDQYNAISYANPLAELTFGMMRNSRKVTSTVKDKTSNTQYFTLTEEYIAKTYYDANYGMIIPYSLFNFNNEVYVWDGTNHGATLPDNTTATYTIDSYLDDGDNIADDSYSFDVTIDNSKPLVESQEVVKNKENGTVKLPMTITENHYVAAVIFESLDGTTLGKYEVENQPGVTLTEEFDITGLGTDFKIIVADYACNETEIEVSIDLSDMPNTQAEPRKLDADRIYGNETYSDSVISMGWFSADKATFTDLKNETFDSTGVTYSGEFVNGYVIAQRASDGALLFLTPYNTYWDAKVIWEQEASVGSVGLKVLYDMAMDYSSDKLYAIGWNYAGDNDGDGKDDGHNALFEIRFAENGEISVVEVAQIQGLENGIDALTLGCTTEGQLYTISTEAKLYSLTKTGETSYIGTTDFVNEANYSGANVIQSMGYDHNDNKMYWYAHSQTYHAGSYMNISATYEVDLSDASCVKVGGIGASGHTSLFVPTEKTSDIFTPNVVATGIQITPSAVSLAVGQSRRMEVEWQPWNAVPGTVTWESKDDSIATVNTNGVVKAVAEGETEIVATAQIDNNGSTKTVTHTAKVTVVGSASALYGFVIRDYNNAGNDQSWITYSDSNPKNVSKIGSGPLWQGGTYYNGYVYTVVMEEWTEGDVMHRGTALYRSTVTQGSTAKETKISGQTLIGKTSGIEVGNIAFDYSTGRMYGVDYTNGGLCIVDIDTGAIDLLGTFSGDLGAAIMPAMCVTANGTIIGSDMSGNLYTVNPDSLNCTLIGSIEPNSWFYAGMTYDHNTGNIYWNPCMDAEISDLYLVRIDENNLTAATTEIIELGGVSSSAGVEQTAMFTIPIEEPETQYIQVEDIQITNGDTLTGLVGGSVQLGTETIPRRPSANAKQWASSDESVVKVDHFGNMTFIGEGTATITVTISNKGENVAGPFSDTITVNVYPAAGELVAFLGYDEWATSYFDFWIKIKDYAPQRSEVGVSMIGTYSLRTGEYYDGYFYAYNDVGEMYRINKDNYEDYITLGSHGLPEDDQVVSMTFDYTSGIMYALTLHIDGNPGYLAKVDLSNGSVTKLHQLDECISAFAVDENGTLYGAGSPGPYEQAALYTINKEDGSCTYIQDIPDAYVYTGNNYMGEIMYSSQMTYDYGTKRLYLNATNKYKGYDSSNYGLYMIQLADEGEDREVSLIANLGRPALELRNSVKVGQMFLGLLCAVPEKHEVSADVVTGIILDRDAMRVDKGAAVQLKAQVSPADASDKTIVWSSEDESVATIDENGMVTGVSVGTTIITATSGSNDEASAQCIVTVIDTASAEKVSTAYTISATQEALVSFNPELPGMAAKKVTTMSGGRRIVGMDIMSDNYIYYLVDAGTWPELYRFDMTTKRSTSLGQLEVFIGGASDMAYDPVHKLIYVVSGFYVFQFEEHRLQAGELNRYAGYLDTSQVAMPLSTMHAVTCKDGMVYFVASNNGAKLYRVNDNLKELTYLRDVAVNTVSGRCEMDYDENTQQFYLTDAGDRLYSFTETGDEVTLIDKVGDGWDINGLAINPKEVPDLAPDPDPTPDPDPGIPKNPFTDVLEDTFYYEAILWAVEEKITSGTSINTFEPEATCTRGQIVTFLWNAAGRPEPETTENPFEDVLEYAYYHDAILWAVEEKIVFGTSVDTFEPEAICTRGDVAAFLWRVAKRPEPKAAENPFDDVVEKAYYYDAILWAVENKIAYGMSSDIFEPDTECTRGEIVTFLYRAKDILDLFH